ncbi:MAG TPA: mobile mystery protein B [Cyanobacteria bacterium UBA9971]|nr:mobile mystery protein B [Cyanobacteria bacterium UBA9971]
MDNLFEVDESSTPLTEEEKNELIPTWITLRKELNVIERAGILNAEKWVFSRKQKNILTEDFIKKLHKKMFGDVWSWAGRFRTTERNIGVPAWQIITDIRNLLEDTKCWIQNKTYSPDEIGARFHHRLVWIHPFPNGNGRHSRLMTDILMKDLGQPRFSWGEGSLIEASELRHKYIQALKSADNGQFLLLLDFIRMKSK